MSITKREATMSNDERIAVLETTIHHLDASLVDIRQDIKRVLDRMETKFDTLDKKIDSKFDTLNNRLWTNFMWIISGMIGLLGVMAHGFHWF